MKTIKKIGRRVIYTGAKIQKFFDFLFDWELGTLLFLGLYIYTFLKIAQIFHDGPYLATDAISYACFGFAIFALFLAFAGVCENVNEKWKLKN